MLGIEGANLRTLFSYVRESHKLLYDKVYKIKPYKVSLRRFIGYNVLSVLKLDPSQLRM